MNTVCVLVLLRLEAAGEQNSKVILGQLLARLTHVGYRPDGTESFRVQGGCNTRLARP